MELNTANISTIATWIAIIITGILAYFGIELDLNALVPLIAAIITFIIAIWSSKNPNEIEALGNAPEPEENITGDCEDDC